MLPRFRLVGILKQWYFLFVSTVKEIQAALPQLSSEELGLVDAA